MKLSFFYGVFLLLILILTKETNGTKEEVNFTKEEEILFENLANHNQRTLGIAMECWENSAQFESELMENKKLSKEEQREVLDKKVREVEEVTGEATECIRKAWSEFPICLKLNNCFLRVKNAVKVDCGPEVKRPSLTLEAGKEKFNKEKFNKQLEQRVNWLKCTGEKKLEKTKEIGRAGGECNAILEKLSAKTCEKLEL